jgi:hypothetical protein
MDTVRSVLAFLSVLAIGLFTPASKLHAATNMAASCSYADVSAAISTALPGDTVSVPAGSCSWGSTVVIGKAIRVIGAGKGATIITNTVGTLVTISGTQNNFVRLSGFTFNNADGQTPIVLIVGPALQVRIDNIVFNKGDAAIGSNWIGAEATGPVYGVVDSSEFYNMVRPYFAMDIRFGEAAWGKIAWTEFLINPTSFPGSAKMMYFEDNQFIWNSSNTAPNVQGALYGGYGGKAAFRYNSMSGLCTYVDAHGDDLQGDYGTIYYEIYNNTLAEDDSLCVQGDIVWMRGGQLIAHDNVFSGVSDPFRMSVYFTTDFPTRRVMNTYYWGNSWNGKTDQSSMVLVNDSGQTPPGYSASNIILNQQYFLNAPKLAQIYYPYTPYPYPHPLREPLQAPFMLPPVVTP